MKLQILLLLGLLAFTAGNSHDFLEQRADYYDEDYAAADRYVTQEENDYQKSYDYDDYDEEYEEYPKPASDDLSPSDKFFLDSEDNDAVVKLVDRCENAENKNVVLSCTNGEKIRISSALYGRTNRFMCNEEPIKDTNCRASSSMSVATTRCNGKSQCILKADNSMFGDPCVGTRKYLDVSYMCVKEEKYKEFVGVWWTSYSNTYKDKFSVAPNGKVTVGSNGRKPFLVPSDDQSHFPTSQGWVKVDKVYRSTTWEYWRIKDGNLQIQHFCSDRCSYSRFQSLGNYCCAGTGLRQDFEHVGCFGDRNARAISGPITNVRSKKYLRVFQCSLRAKQEKTEYFSVEAGYACFTSHNAGKTYTRYGKVGNCANGVGGGWAMDVYKRKIHPCDTPNVGGCADKCVKDGEKARCVCTIENMVLDADNKACVMVHPCDLKDKFGCADKCVKDGINARCVCTNKVMVLAADNKACVNAHPCDLKDKFGCADKCVKDGEYARCVCTNEVMVLAADNKACVNAHPCDLNDKFGCADKCVKDGEKARCVCTNEVMVLAADNKACVNAHPCDLKDKFGCADKCVKDGEKARCVCTNEVMVLAADNKACVNAHPCDLKDKAGCADQCVKEGEKAVCVCTEKGMVLSADNKNCVKGCSPWMCKLHCSHGFQKDKNDCNICKCNPRPGCSRKICHHVCPHGYHTDANGCAICKCKHISPGPVHKAEIHITVHTTAGYSPRLLVQLEMNPARHAAFVPDNCYIASSMDKFPSRRAYLIRNRNPAVKSFRRSSTMTSRLFRFSTPQYESLYQNNRPPYLHCNCRLCPPGSPNCRFAPQKRRLFEGRRYRDFASARSPWHPFRDFDDSIMVHAMTRLPDLIDE